jgi:hypothetical protein
MTYTLRVHAPEAEPYTGLRDYDEIREVVEQECGNTVNELGSDILETGSEAERELVTEHLADDAMLDLWRVSSLPPDVQSLKRTEHRLPGPRHGRRSLGVLLSLEEEEREEWYPSLVPNTPPGYNQPAHIFPPVR